MRLNESYINADNKDEILRGGNLNAKFSWYFHVFKAKYGKAPTKTDISNATRWLCKAPRVSNVSGYFKDNLSAGAETIKNKCKLEGDIQKRDTTNYVVDLLLAYAAPDKLDIQAYANAILDLE